MNARTTATALAACSALLAVAAPAASADPTAIAKDRAQGGPALTATGVAWASGTGAALSLRAADPGSPAATLFTAPAPAGDNTLGAFGVAASATRTVVGVQESYESEGGGGTDASNVFGAPTGSAFAQLAGAREPGRIATSIVNALDLSGDDLLTIETAPATGDTRLLARDLAAGTPATQVGPTGVFRGRIAGRYVAYVEPSKKANEITERVHVVDRTSGKDAYTVDVPITPPYAFGFALDVQDDGTLAVLAANPATSGQHPRGDVAWASIADPKLHTIATDVDVDYGLVRIAGGRVAYVRAHGPLVHLTGGPAQRLQREVVVADIAGGGAGAPASFPLPGVTGLDFDGTRVAYTTFDCVYADAAPGATPVPPTSGPCAQVGTVTYSKTVSGRGRVKAAVGCLLAPTGGCTGTVTVRQRRANGTRGPALATAALQLEAGAGKTVSLTVPAKTLAKLRKGLKKSRKTIYVDVVTSAVEPGGKHRTSYQQALLRVR